MSRLATPTFFESELKYFIVVDVVTGAYLGRGPGVVFVTALPRNEVIFLFSSGSTCYWVVFLEFDVAVGTTVTWLFVTFYEL